MRATNLSILQLHGGDKNRAFRSCPVYCCCCCCDAHSRALKTTLESRRPIIDSPAPPFIVSCDVTTAFRLDTLLSVHAPLYKLCGWRRAMPVACAATTYQRLTTSRHLYVRERRAQIHRSRFNSGAAISEQITGYRRYSWRHLSGGGRQRALVASCSMFILHSSADTQQTLSTVVWCSQIYGFFRSLESQHR